MKVLFLLMSSLALASTPTKIASSVESFIIADDANFTYTKSMFDTGMNRALQKAIDELNRRGYVADANIIQDEWQSKFGGSLFTQGRDIGDHKGISDWITETYRRIELILGASFCVESHIAAMLTFNNGIPVVLHPCTFPMDGVSGEPIDEYRRNFAGKSPVSDSKYNGVVPEACYFACEIACLAATSGIGSILCGGAATVGEKLMATFVAPKLADRIYSKRCLGKELGDYQ